MEKELLLFLWTFCVSWVYIGFFYGIHKLKQVRKKYGSLLNQMKETSSKSDKVEEMVNQVGKEKANRVFQYSFVVMMSFIWVYMMVYEYMVKRGGR